MSCPKGRRKKDITPVVIKNFKLAGAVAGAAGAAILTHMLDDDSAIGPIIGGGLANQ